MFKFWKNQTKWRPTFPKNEGDYAFVVDGQHRLFSFRDEYRRIPDDEIFELPVIALFDASDEVVGATFVAINVNQKPVNRDLLTQMKAIEDSISVRPRREMFFGQLKEALRVRPPSS